ncbi:hypothetical protein LQW54_001439 [Pestalotiopsis sp. IQ-011]
MPPESPQAAIGSPHDSDAPTSRKEPDHDTTMSEPTAKQPEAIVSNKSDATTATTTAEADGQALTNFQSGAKDELKQAVAQADQPAQDTSKSLPSGDAFGLHTSATQEAEERAPEPPAKDDPADKGKGREVSNQPTDERMEDSVATLKPKKPQYLTIETPAFVDPTPPTPSGSQPPSRSSSARSRGHAPEPPPTRSEVGYDDRRYASEDEQEGHSRSEIQSIMEQFPEEGGGPDVEAVMSPRLEIASPFFANPSPQHPPRKSSLEPIGPGFAQQLQEMQGLRISTSSPTSTKSKPKEKDSDDQGPPVPPKDGVDQMPQGEPQSPAATMHRPPPPEPEPEPSLPFDFHRFLEQLKNKKADPVARYLKSFLQEFAKRQWMVHEQVKIISDFLAFIANKMAQCEVWRDVSDAEFDNAREGMEKLVMNRLYTQTFSPAIPPPQPIPGSKSRRRGDQAMGPGRRGQHQEDVERDEILTQKINIYGWVREEHLDIPATSDSGKRFLTLAQQELLKIRSYRAPRDKIICVLNCCKVIFGLLKNAKSDSSADSFMPLLIYVVLQSNPDHLVSNVQYILRFRNQEKLGGEAGYYLSSLMGAIQFVENMDRTSLTITDEDFEKNVESAVSTIAEKHRHADTSPRQEQYSEKTGLNSPGESSTRPSLDVDSTGTPRRSLSSDQSDDNAPITGLLRSIQKPLSTIGRMFSDEPGPSSSPSRTPQTDGTPRISPRPSTDGRPSRETRQQLSAQEAAARQASAEVAEAQRLHRAEHNNVVETLAGMFPDLDRDIISDVVYQKEGRVGQAVDACLALSS